ncbi:hypothetical protein [Streptomyces sp. NPDC058424]|uniref:hypothetical protein n=1 Tax=Streptomyces sp. NPDC058424 TaxID=3346491 RepID=UPI003659A070
MAVLERVTGREDIGWGGAVPVRVRENRPGEFDFGGLSVGFPDAEHSTVWDLPPQARQAYWDTLNLDDLTWTRARA